VGDTPTPSRFTSTTISTEDVRERARSGSPGAALARQLMTLIRGERHVTVLRCASRSTRLSRTGHTRPSLAVGIGRAGERVAQQVHADRAGSRHPARRSHPRGDRAGGYLVVSPTGVPLAEQLEGIERARSLAVVDDTIFSGITMRQVLEALSPVVRAHTHAFCLRCVAESLVTLRTLCPVTPGFAAPGRILDEVSFINASGLVRRGSIRRAGRPALAFFERPEWIRAWFRVV
jgi:hypothetical protein